MQLDSETIKLLPRVHPDIATELKTVSKPWSLKAGSKHIKIVVDRTMVGIIPLYADKKQADRRCVLNVRSQIRRAKVA